MELVRRVRETIIRYSMLSAGDHVLIGLSGGPDSVCLALVLDILRGDLNISLSAIYIDHGLRPDEVEKEKTFCKQFCEERGIGHYSRYVDVRKHAERSGLNLQEAARELRYQALEETADRIKASRIALGHNADDQAETILMRLFRGSGRKGLSGIPPVRGKIIRPLIEIERRDIEEFLTQNEGEYCNTPLQTNGHSSLPFMVDSSNLKDDYFRNWIRSSIMSEIKKKNPSVVEDICRTADIFREEDDYLEIIVTKTLMRLISRKDDESIELFLFPLTTIERPVLRRVLRRAIGATRGLRGISYSHVDNIIGLINKGQSGDSLNLPGDIRAIRDYSVLRITSRGPVRLSAYEIAPPADIVISEADIRVSASLEDKCAEVYDGRSSVLLDAGEMVFPLKIRARSNGDYFYPMGFGKKKKLQDFFVDEKVPRDERDRVPIIVSGNDIIWVAGFRADDRFKITEKTEKFLRLKIHKL